MKALILAGGFGTRLRPLSCTRPKILFPILNKPLLQWILEKMKANDVDEVIMAVNSQTAFQIKQSKLQKNDIKISYSLDPPGKPLGTGGPVKIAEKLLRNDDFLALNGDVFTDINYAELMKFHKKVGAIATIALHKVDDPSRYGVAELADDGRILRFIEKPPVKMAPSNLINAGVYAFNPKIFEYIPEGRKVSMEREVFPKLAEQGALYGYVYDGLWYDIGEVREYLRINLSMLSLYACDTYILKHFDNVEVKKPVLIDEKSSIGNGSIIGPNVILGSKVCIGRNVQIRNSIIMPGVEILDNTVIDGAVIGENVKIGRNVKISEKCIIGDYAIIGDNVFLGEGVSICPAREVLESISSAIFDVKCW